MILKLKLLLIISVLFFSTALLISGCGEREAEDVDTIDTTAIIDEPMEDTTAISEERYPDITGTWSGSLADRPTTMVITSQDSNQVQGRITINYRNPVNQEFKGEFNFDEKTFSMRDQNETRYQGKYSGKISDDFTKLTGTFTQIVDNQSAQFTLTKKQNEENL